MSKYRLLLYTDREAVSRYRLFLYTDREVKRTVSRYSCSCTHIERLGEAVSRYRLFLYTVERLCPGTGCSCTQ